MEKLLISDLWQLLNPELLCGFLSLFTLMAVVQLCFIKFFQVSEAT